MNTADGTIRQVTAWVKTVSHDLQKPAALVIGFLAYFGVTPDPGGKAIAATIPLAYAAIIHVVETIKGTSTGNGA